MEASHVEELVVGRPLDLEPALRPQLEEEVDEVVPLDGVEPPGGDRLLEEVPEVVGDVGRSDRDTDEPEQGMPSV